MTYTRGFTVHVVIYPVNDLAADNLRTEGAWDKRNSDFDEKYKIFLFKKYIWKCLLQNVGHFV